MNKLSLNLRLIPACAPPFIAAILITTVLTLFFYGRGLDQQILAHGLFLAKQTAWQISANEEDKNYEDFEQHTQFLVDNDPLVNSISLFNSEKKLNRQIGLTPTILLNTEEWEPLNTSGINFVKAGSKMGFSLRLPENTSATQNEWLLIELNRGPNLIKKYQMAIIICLIALISSICYLFFVPFFNKRLFKSLKTIETSVDDLIDGRSDLQPHSNLHELFTPLVDKLKNLHDILDKKKHDSQLAIEQTTEDLHETLDTIERQNIELNLARKQSLKINQEKSQFLANTSHEIRTPINAIIGFANLLENSSLNETQSNYLDTIQRSSSTLLTFFNNLVDYSKLELGQLSLDHNPIQLVDLIENCVFSLIPIANQKELELIPIISPQCPQNYLGDPLRIQQIITNMIMFFVRSTTTNSIVLRVNSSNENNEGMAVLNFSINLLRGENSNISEKNLLSFFSNRTDDSGKQDDSHEGSAELNLSLNLCRQLSEVMSGSMGYQTSETSLSLWASLPLKLNHSIPEKINIHDFSSLKIAVFEQQQFIREHLVTLLSNWKVQTIVASTFKSIADTLNQHADTSLDIVFLGSIDGDESDKRNFFDKLSLYSEKHGAKFIGINEGSLPKPKTASSFGYLNLKTPIARDGLKKILADLINPQTTTKPVTPNLPTENSIAILAVDDNPANLQLIAELLQALNIKVTRAANGAEAIEKMKGNQFDLIFMDLQMPVMDGMETTRKIRSQESRQKRIPIVALTAHAMSEKKSQLLIAGMDDYICKPVSENQLIHCLKRWLGDLFSPAASPPTPSSDIFSRTENSVAYPTLPEKAELVDLKQCLALSNGRPDLASDMLQHLLAGLPYEIEKIEDLYKSNQFSDLAESVHKLHGGTCYCGVPRLHQASKKLDKILQEEHPVNIHHPLREMLDSARQLLHWSEQFDIPVLFGIEETTSLKK